MQGRIRDDLSTGLFGPVLGGTSLHLIRPSSKRLPVGQPFDEPSLGEDFYAGGWRLARVVGRLAVPPESLPSPRGGSSSNSVGT